MYIITFLTSLGFLHVSEKHKNKYVRNFCVVIALLIPSILAGLRDYSVGNDVLLYGNGWFERATTYNSLFEYLSKANEYSVGVGYGLVNYVISRLTNNPHVFYFIYELLQVVILYLIVYRYKEKISITFAFAVYYFSYYNLSLSMLRQIMAMLLVLHSYKYIEERNLVKYVINIFFAAMFHSSAIIGLVLYLIKILIDNKQLKIIYKALIVGGCLVGVLLYQQVFSFLSLIGINGIERYSHYMTDSEVGGRFIRFTYWTALSILIFLRGKKCKSYYQQSEYLQLIMVISTVCSVVLFIGSTWIIRIAYYFDVFQVLYLPILAPNLGVAIGRNKKAGYLILLLLVVVNWLITFVIRNGAATYPFVFMK